MKRAALFLAALALGLALGACGGGEAYGRIQVSIVETAGLTVENNGRWIEPGENVEFLLTVSPGREISNVLYDGGYRLNAEGGRVRLELLDVRYPLRARVELTQAEDPTDQANLLRDYRTITYEPNGGEGEPVAETYRVTVHTRPNTSQGPEGFQRKGYTLTGWNTAPDGSGRLVGLGSRITVPNQGLTLYAQWLRWTEESLFDFEDGEDGLCITGYHGEEDTVVIPGTAAGTPVTAIAAGAFAGCSARRVVLPPGLAAVEEGAFTGAALEELTLFDSIGTVSDAAFEDCARLRTLHINAAEDPYGYRYRRESLYADKVDLLINARGTRKIVFYGGCSMWYNLIGSEAVHAFPDYTVINMGLNGTVNSLIQMEILGTFLEEGDILFHAPELSSTQQLLLDTDMHSEDDKLWCGLEYNYDLLALVDLRGIGGVFDSLAGYLQKKQPGGSYAGEYKDASGNVIMDRTGSITLLRLQPLPRLSETDEVTLDPAGLEGGLPALSRIYGEYGAKGVRVYVSYACIDREALPPEQRDNGPEMERRLRELIEAMDGPAVISSLEDYFYVTRDFYDTHYHLLTPQAYGNTEKWLRDLAAQMEADGLTG